MTCQHDEIKRECFKLAKSYEGPLLSYRPFENISNRKYWNSLDSEIKSWIISEGEKALLCNYPVILATDFMNFKRTGNRKMYEDAFFERRFILNSLVLAECVENKGRFLDRIIDGIFVICEESTWCLPAHNSYIRNADQLILPDSERPVLDLFACETGATISMVNYLLKPVLDDISPFITGRIEYELRKRIIDPYLNSHFWWMGNGAEPMCNWTPWCIQNVLLTAFLSDQLITEDEKKQIFLSSSDSLDMFLKDYGEDGCCDEGAHYYRHAGLCLFGALDVLNEIAPDAFIPIFNTAKIKNIAAYISIVHVHGPRYFNFADCSSHVGAAGVREYLFGKATGQQFLVDFAASDFADTYARKTFLADESQKLNLFYRAQSMHYAKEVLNNGSKVTNNTYAPDIYYESAGIWIARNKTFAVAVKAGDNDDSHNHNDVGSIILYKNGQPVLVDIGVETYTAKTFSPQRYEIWTMRSEYHNTPTINGQNELPGEKYRATNVKYNFDGPVKSISMNIDTAYDNIGNLRYLRSVKLDNALNSITIEDTTDVTKVILNFISYFKPEIGDSSIKLGEAVMSFDRSYAIKCEVLPITDERLQTAWDHDLYRILVETNGSCRINID